ncbi:hypothetical protein RQP46_006681 [Phenoliferia psychrophenolica]
MPSDAPVASTFSASVQAPPKESAAKPAAEAVSAPTKAAATADKPAEAAVEEKDAAKAGPTAAETEADLALSESELPEPSSDQVVDMEVFGQLLEIDDDDEHEFSKTLAFDYISQADTTFEEIDAALTERDLDTLSRKGHFLKGSSAALGLQRVQRSCELMQHFGNRRDDKGEGPEMSEDAALRKCQALLARLRREQGEAKDWLVDFYKS